MSKPDSPEDRERIARYLAWREELSELEAGGEFPLRYVATVSRPQHCPNWTGCTGRVEKKTPMPGTPTASGARRQARLARRRAIDEARAASPEG